MLRQKGADASGLIRELQDLSCVPGAATDLLLPSISQWLCFPVVQMAEILSSGNHSNSLAAAQCSDPASLPAKLRWCPGGLAVCHWGRHERCVCLDYSHCSLWRASQALPKTRASKAPRSLLIKDSPPPPDPEQMWQFQSDQQPLFGKKSGLFLCIRTKRPQ